MKLKKTKFKDLVIYEKNTYKDKRGYFRELYLQKHFNNKFPFEHLFTKKKDCLREKKDKRDASSQIHFLLTTQHTQTEEERRGVSRRRSQK